MGLDRAGNELANVATGELTKVAASPWTYRRGRIAFALTGDFVGRGILEQSFDGGETAIPVSLADGSAREFTAPDRVVVDEPEAGVQYRFRVLERTSGTFRWRFAQ